MEVGDGDAEGGHEEDFDAADVRGVVHVVVACHGAPGCRGAVDDRQQGEDGAGEVCACIGCWGGVVGVAACLAKDDHEDHEEDEPGVSLVDENGIESHEGDCECHDSEDNDSENQGDVSV